MDVEGVVTCALRSARFLQWPPQALAEVAMKFLEEGGIKDHVEGLSTAFGLAHTEVADASVRCAGRHHACVADVPIKLPYWHVV